MRNIRLWQMGMVLLMLTLVGCSTNGKGELKPNPQTSTSERSVEQVPSPCNAIIEWIDFLMINGIKYYHVDEGISKVSPTQITVVDEVGKVAYMLNDHACTDYVVKNGDAAFLPIGTVIYALEGYKPSFRVVANNKIYQVDHNPNAQTLQDLFDIDGRVKKVSLESGIDGSHIGDFSPEASSTFAQALLALSYVGYEAVYKKMKSESGIFLRVHLQDDTSFRMVYYPVANAFSAGAFGTEALRTLILSERKRIKAAAGM